MSLFDPCTVYRVDLGAFIDGELAGAERMRMTEHVERCPACGVEAERLRNIGLLLRDMAGASADTPISPGLASGVVTRVRAEAAQSWRAVMNRGFDDWHWFIVGGGSVAATFVSMLFVTALLILGSAPVQQDSLAGLMSSLQTHPGTLVVEVGGAKESDVMDMDSGESSVRVIPAQSATEQDLVSAFMSLVMSERGGIVSLAEMPAGERRSAEALLQRIGEHREGRSGSSARGLLEVVRIRLLATTGVSAPVLW